MSKIIIAGAARRELIYSKKCYDGKFLMSGDGPKTFLEVSRAPTEPLIPEGPGADKKVLQNVNAAISVITGGFALGIVLAPFPTSLVFAGLAAVGGLIKAGLSFWSGENPVKEQMRVLKQKIDELEERTNGYFQDMKMFITENQFSVEIINEVSTLKKYMKDCLEYQNEEAIENFQAAYEHHSPLDIAYVLLSMLKQNSTNPLVMATKINGSGIKYSRWESIIKALIGELQFLEGFAAGLLFDEDPHDWDRLEVVKGEIHHSIDEQKNKCWEEFKTYFKTFIETEYKLSIAEKADALKEKLDQYGTGDSFYICVLNDDEALGQQFYCHCPNGDSQLIELRNVKGCSAFVYRSTLGNNYNNTVYSDVRWEVESQIDSKIKNYKPPKDIVEEYLLAQKLVRSDGLVCMIHTYMEDYSEVRSANCHDHEWGPGWWNRVRELGKTMPQWKLIVGLP